MCCQAELLELLPLPWALCPGPWELEGRQLLLLLLLHY
jgi:hypothetical protein